MRDYLVYWICKDGVEEETVVRARTHTEAAEIIRPLGDVIAVEADIDVDGDFYQWTGGEIDRPWAAYDGHGYIDV